MSCLVQEARFSGITRLYRRLPRALHPIRLICRASRYWRRATVPMLLIGVALLRRLRLLQMPKGPVATPNSGLLLYRSVRLCPAVLVAGTEPRSVKATFQTHPPVRLVEPRAGELCRRADFLERLPRPCRPWAVRRYCPPRLQPRRRPLPQEAWRPAPRRPLLAHRPHHPPTPRRWVLLLPHSRAGLAAAGRPGRPRSSERPRRPHQRRACPPARHPLHPHRRDQRLVHRAATGRCPRRRRRSPPARWYRSDTRRLRRLVETRADLRRRPRRGSPIARSSPRPKPFRAQSPRRRC